MNTRPYKLLTIAIPTYNRASYLDKCLSHICGQLRKGEPRVEILISDNNSTDNTPDIADRYISDGFAVNYIRNAENIGSDRNFLQCFGRANGRYVLILGDDDILLDGSVEKILDILEGDEYGIVHLRSYGFAGDFISERPKGYFRGYTVYTNPKKFARRANYFLTFTSVNIVNKVLAGRDPDVGKFVDTNLVQLGWTFSALLNSRKNVFVKEYLIAAQLYNSGGYGLCEVFGVKFNKISNVFVDKGVDREVIEIINKKMLLKFFPANIIRSRMHIINTEEENYFKILYPLYHRYMYFWIFTLPAIVLPSKIAYFLFSFMNFARRFTVTIRSVLDRYFLL